MKKNLFLFLAGFFLFLNYQGKAQAPDINVVWGKIMKSKDSNFGFIIGSDDHHFYTLGTKSRGFVAMLLSSDYLIKKYDRNTFQMVSSTLVPEFEYKGKDANLEAAYLINDEVHLYFQVYNTKIDSKFMVLRIIDKKGRLGKPVEIASVRAEKRSDSNFNLTTSRDSSKILVYSDLPYEKKENEKFQVQVFDREHELLWERVIALPYTDKYFSIKEKAVANNGDVFIIGYASPDKYKGEKRKRKESNQDYKLLHITEEGDITEFDLDLDEKFVNSASIKVDFKTETMAVAGFYSNESFGGIVGSFYITIDQNTLEAKTASSEPFTKKFLTNFMSERKAEKGRELGKFVFRNFIRREDGGAVIVAEQHFVYVSTTTINGRTSSTTYYVYNDIIVININPDGSIEWTAHVPKEQRTANDGGFYLGYLLLVEKSRLHFIYNDHRKNLDRIAEGKDIKGVGNLKKSVSIVATIEEDGSISFDELFRNRDFSAILVPKQCISTADEEAIIYGIRGSKTRFGKLTFQ